MLETQNEAWGFYGTMKTFAPTAWSYAMDRIVAITGLDDEEVRTFLDSRSGRHFADDVNNYLFEGMDLTGAIDAAIRRWMGWRLRPAEARKHRVPAGVDYLTAWISIIAAEAA